MSKPVSSCWKGFDCDKCTKMLMINSLCSPFPLQECFSVVDTWKARALWFWTNMIKLTPSPLCLLVILMEACLCAVTLWSTNYSDYVHIVPTSRKMPGLKMVDTSGISIICKRVTHWATGLILLYEFPFSHTHWANLVIKDENSVSCLSRGQVTMTLPDTGRILGSDPSLKWHLACKDDQWECYRTGHP